MTTQEELHAKYLQFKTDRAAYQKESQRKWIKFAAMRGLPLIVVGFILGNFDNLIMDIIFFVVTLAGFGVLAYAGYQCIEVDPKKFKKGFEWEETLKSYLKELGVDTEKMEPAYDHKIHTAIQVGPLKHDFLYGGSVPVNGTTDYIEIIEIGGFLRVFTDKRELVPTL